MRYFCFRKVFVANSDNNDKTILSAYHVSGSAAQLSKEELI